MKSQDLTLILDDAMQDVFTGAACCPEIRELAEKIAIDLTEAIELNRLDLVGALNDQLEILGSIASVKASKEGWSMLRRVITAVFKVAVL